MVLLEIMSMIFDIGLTYHLYKIEYIHIDEGDNQILLTDSLKYMEEYLLRYKKGETC